MWFTPELKHLWGPWTISANQEGQLRDCLRCRVRQVMPVGYSRPISVPPCYQPVEGPPLVGPKLANS